MARFTDCPPELVDRFLHFVRAGSTIQQQQRDMYNVSLVSPQFRQIAFPHLYAQFYFNNDAAEIESNRKQSDLDGQLLKPEHGKRLRQFITHILTDSYLASQVQSVEIGHFALASIWETLSQWKSRPQIVDEKELRLFQNALFSANIEENGRSPAFLQPYRSMAHGSEDALVALLISWVPNLRRLKLNGRAGGSSQIRKALQNLASVTEPNSLSGRNLEHVIVGLPEEDWPSFPLSSLLRFLTMPKIQKFEAIGIRNNVVIDWHIDQQQVSSPVKEIILRDCEVSGATLAEFLRPMRDLEVLCLNWPMKEYKNPRPSNIMSSTPAVAQILWQCSRTLHTLKLVDTPPTNVSIDYIARWFAYPIRSLASFERLKQFDVSCVLLLRGEALDQTGALKLHEVLPRSLETLKLRYVTKGLFKAVKVFLGHRLYALPNLRLFQILLTGMCQHLRNELNVLRKQQLADESLPIEVEIFNWQRPPANTPPPHLRLPAIWRVDLLSYPIGVTRVS
jgi:hypothetical protein